MAGYQVGAEVTQEIADGLPLGSQVTWVTHGSSPNPRVRTKVEGGWMTNGHTTRTTFRWMPDYASCGVVTVTRVGNYSVGDRITSTEPLHALPVGSEVWFSDTIDRAIPTVWTKHDSGVWRANTYDLTKEPSGFSHGFNNRSYQLLIKSIPDQTAPPEQEGTPMTTARIGTTDVNVTDGVARIGSTVVPDDIIRGLSAQGLVSGLGQAMSTRTDESLADRWQEFLTAHQVSPDHPLLATLSEQFGLPMPGPLTEDIEVTVRVRGVTRVTETPVMLRERLGASGGGAAFDLAERNWQFRWNTEIKVPVEVTTGECGCSETPMTTVRPLVEALVTPGSIHRLDLLSRSCSNCSDHDW